MQICKCIYYKYVDFTSGKWVQKGMSQMTCVIELLPVLAENT